MSLLEAAEGPKTKRAKKEEPSAPKKPPTGGDLPTGPSMERYAMATVKQISLQFVGTEYRQVIARLRRVMEKGEFDNHCEAFLGMLAHWEKEHGLDAAAE